MRNSQEEYVLEDEGFGDDMEKSDSCHAARVPYLQHFFKLYYKPFLIFLETQCVNLHFGVGWDTQDGKG